MVLKTKLGKSVWKEAKSICNIDFSAGNKIDKECGKISSRACWRGVQGVLGEFALKDVVDKKLYDDINQIIHIKITKEIDKLGK